MNYNKITSIAFLSQIGEFGDNLQYIDVSDNALPLVDSEVISQLRGLGRDNNFGLDLSRNLFLCVCEFTETARWLKSTTGKIVHKNSYTCKTDGIDDTSVSTLNTDSLCPATVNIGLISGTSIGVTILLGLLISIIVIKFKYNILCSYYLFKWKIRIYFKHQAPGDRFDAYVIYNDLNSPDRKYAIDTLRTLAETEWKCNLFLWDRDAIPGRNTAANISDGMLSSKKIIIIHSSNLFLSPTHDDSVTGGLTESVENNRNGVKRKHGRLQW